MKYYPHPILAKEGWLFIIGIVLFTILVWYLGNFWISLPFILISIFIIQFFRDPKREIPTEANAILAPADGRVICIEKAHDEYHGQVILFYREI